MDSPLVMSYFASRMPFHVVSKLLPWRTQLYWTQMMITFSQRAMSSLYLLKMTTLIFPRSHYLRLINTYPYVCPTWSRKNHQVCVWEDTLSWKIKFIKWHITIKKLLVAEDCAHSVSVITFNCFGCRLQTLSFKSPRPLQMMQRKFCFVGGNMTPMILFLYVYIHMYNVAAAC
jgi:hypothetical protein